jgi:tetratricopeptide (TPR) repeat protein
MLIQNDGDLKRFISELVLKNSALLKLRDGVIARLPSLDPSYEIYFPSDLPVRNYIDVILQQIRRTSANAIMYIFLEDELIQKRRKLAEVLQCFENDDHFENQYSLGLSEMKERNYPKAKAHFEKSLEIINRDPIIDQNKLGLAKETLSRLITQCDEK